MGSEEGGAGFEAIDEGAAVKRREDQETVGSDLGGKVDGLERGFKKREVRFGDDEESVIGNFLKEGAGGITQTQAVEDYGVFIFAFDGVGPSLGFLDGAVAGMEIEAVEADGEVAVAGGFEGRQFVGVDGFEGTGEARIGLPEGG